MMLVALTAFFVWLALFRHHGWAWIPAAIFGFNVAQNLLGGFTGSVFLPLAVIAAGVLMLSRGRMSSQATVGVLVLLAVIGIAARNAGVGEEPGRIEPESTTSSELAAEDPDAHPLPALRGRELVVLAEDIDVVLRAARRGTGTVTGDGVGISEESSEVLIIDVTSVSGRAEVTVPAEASVHVRSTFGDVDAEVGAFSLDIDTVAGDIEIDLDGDHAVTAESAEGSVRAEGVDDLDPADNLLATEIVGPRVRVKTLTGDISVTQG